MLALAVVFTASVASAEEDAPAADPKAEAAALIDAWQAKDADVAARVEAIQAAAGLQHESLTSPLIKLLSVDTWGVREAAVEALASRTDKGDRKKAATALAARLPRLAKPGVARDEHLQAIAALGRLDQPASVRALLGGIDHDTDLEVIRASIEAVAAIPAKESVEGLIDFLALGRRGGREKARDLARKGLKQLTGAAPDEDNRQAGRDADRWRAWWRENEKGFDFEALRAAREAEAKEAAEREEATRAKKADRERAKKEREGKAGEGKAGEGKAGAGKGRKPKDDTPPPVVPD
ncbi:MAG: HEAT repeat domain-containing protein [Planctomycetota bacterium]|nr:HEAT repeat domain-containing protein [Planctomycetota bacterium]